MIVFTSDASDSVDVRGELKRLQCQHVVATARRLFTLQQQCEYRAIELTAIVGIHIFATTIIISTSAVRLTVATILPGHSFPGWKDPYRIL